MTSSAGLPEKLYGGQGATERQAGRQERLRAAALELIAANGTASLSINAVCAAAGLNKRYFYESYESRDALLVELLTSFFDDFYARAQREVPEASPAVEGRFRHALGSLLAVLEADPGVARLYAEATSEPGLVALWGSQVERFIDVAGAVTELDATNPRTRFILLALVSGVTEALTHWLREEPRTLDREEVIDVAAGLAIAFVAAVP